jgi:hypothetical protein
VFTKAEDRTGQMTQKAIDLVRELRGNLCRCGATKVQKQTFCGACYHRLSHKQQMDLYLPLSGGYIEAYDAAVASLDAK